MPILILVVYFGCGVSVVASDTVVIVITANPEPNALIPPTNFTAVRDGNDIVFSWTPNPLSTGTTIIINGQHYPVDVTDGAVVTSTDNSTYRLVDGYSDIFQNYYSAFSESGLGYSIYYATAMAGGMGMLVSVFLLFSLGLTVTGYAFKLDFLKFIAGIGWCFSGYFVSYNYTWLGTAQWVFIVIGFCGIALPLWIHTLWTMSINRRDKKQAKAKALYTEGDDDEIDQEYEMDRKEFDRISKRYPSKQTVRSQRRNALFGR